MAGGSKVIDKQGATVYGTLIQFTEYHTYNIDTNLSNCPSLLRCPDPVSRLTMVDIIAPNSSLGHLGSGRSSPEVDLGSQPEVGLESFCGEVFLTFSARWRQ